MTPTGLPLFTSRALTLEAGNCLQIPVAAGTVIQVTQGQLRLTQSPRWLAETMFWAGVSMDEGQAHAVAQSGWLMLLALGEGEVRWFQHEPVSIWARAAHLWRAMAQAPRQASRYALGSAIFANSTARRSRLSEGQISEAL